jgi:alkaline phosphatase D
VRLAFGGDLAGQNVCRHESEGFPIFRAVAAVRPNLFVGLGDMIYADGVCTAVGRYGNAQIPGAFEPAARMLNFWAHWRYSREDEAFRAVLTSMPYVAVWDDHEVVNDFGPHDDTRDGGPYSPDEQLMPLGLAAFLDYNPVPERDVPEGRIFRSVRWGRHLELFVLDTRQYRDPAGEADDPADPKTLLGAEQREWLKQALVRSDATWKVVVTSVPLSIPTGRPERRDGWANFKQEGGYEHELLDILGTLRDRGVDNTVWITADVHFAAVHRYAPFAGSDFRLHEVAAGPLNAGLFANDRMDETLGGERLFAYAPEDPEALSTWEEARRFFNFGLLEIDEPGALTIRIVNTAGEIVYDLPLEPSPRPASTR